MKIKGAQKLRTNWLRQNSAVLLHFSSAIVPETLNYLSTLPHQGAKAFRITEVLI